jgi:hypothetical protein
MLLGGDAAHIHSPAGGQGMNTGIQDMINLSWKLALVMRGQAPSILLDTYEQDRLPVMRHVLTRTEGLTSVMGSESPLVRTLFNFVGPWIGGAGLVQDNAAAQMSQIALGYRDSPLSANHAHGGALLAGDRVPDLPVRVWHNDAWQDDRLHAVLDPSRFVLLATRPDQTAARPAGVSEAVRPWGDLIRVAEIMPAVGEAAQARFRSVFGHYAGALLVRPDGYAGLAAGGHGAAAHVQSYCRRWLTAAG